MKKWHRIGICLLLTVCLLMLPACKKSQPATETTGAAKETTGAANTPTAAPPASTPAETPEETQTDPIELYKDQYPEFFGVPGEHGLVVYILQTEQNDYRCNLLPYSDTGYPDSVLNETDKYTADLAVMRAIVNYYIENDEVRQSQVYIRGIQTDYVKRTYGNLVLRFYNKHLEALFWASDVLFNYGTPEALCFMDIDNDGFEEECAVFSCTSYHRNDFIMIACENGKLEYFNHFIKPFDFAEFDRDDKGNLVLYGWDAEYENGSYTFPKEPYYIQVGTYDGNIVLTCPNLEVAYYYGDQGLDSEYAPELDDLSDPQLPEQIAAYKFRYPQCFNLLTKNGLSVYVWHHSSGIQSGYYCTLLPGQEQPKEPNNLSWHAVPIEAMRQIVAYYIESGAVTKEQVTVRGVLPADGKTSYGKYADPFYFNDMTAHFWASDVLFNYKQHLYTLAVFDIDGDGVLEECAVFSGVTSGVGDFIMIACQDGKPEYFGHFNHPFTFAEFRTDDTGKTVLLGWDTKAIPGGSVLADEPYYINIGVSEGNIILTSDDVRISNYGGQGLDSELAPK